MRPAPLSDVIREDLVRLSAGAALRITVGDMKGRSSRVRDVAFRHLNSGGSGHDDGWFLDGLLVVMIPHDSRILGVERLEIEFQFSTEICAEY